MRVLLALLQATAIPMTPIPPPERIDLLSLGPKGCPVDSDPDDILVCGSRRTDRLAPLPDRPGPPPLPPMTVRLPGGGTANLHATSSELPGGHGSGAMVTVKIPF